MTGPRAICSLFFLSSRSLVPYCSVSQSISFRCFNQPSERSYRKCDFSLFRCVCLVGLVAHSHRPVGNNISVSLSIAKSECARRTYRIAISDAIQRIHAHKHTLTHTYKYISMSSSSLNDRSLITGNFYLLFSVIAIALNAVTRTTKIWNK